MFPRGTILSVRGEPITSEPKRLTAPLDLDIPTAERRVYLADAPSPAWLRGVVESATKGRPRDFIDFLDLVRERDGRIDSCAQRLEGAVSSLEWAVIPADVDDDLKDRAAEIANDADRMLRRLEFLPSPGSDLGQGGFEDGLQNLASMFYYGWATAEAQWDYISSVGRWEPVQLAFRHPRRIAWDDNFRPRLYDPGSHGPAGMWPGMELEPLRWLVMRGKVRPGYPTRDGLGRTACWLYAFKRFSWKDFVQFSEQFGTPFVLGVAGGGNNDQGHIIDDDTARVLKEVVRNLRGRSRGVIDGRDRIDILWPQVTGKTIVPAEVITMVNDEIAVLFQGATQAVSVGDKGTYASAETHKGVERDKVQRYGRTLSNGVTFGLLRGWFRLNYPEAFAGDELCPAFWMDAAAPADVAAEMSKDKMLYEVGYPLMKSDLADRYNRPLPDETAEEEDILERAAPTDPWSFLRSSEGEKEEEAEGEPKAKSSSSRPPRRRVLAENPEDVDEDAFTEVYESHVEEYVKVADKVAKNARTSALDVASSWIDSQSVDPGVKAFTEELVSHLSPAYAKVIKRGKFRPVIEGIYEAFKMDPMGLPEGAVLDFSGNDMLFTEALNGLDGVHWSEYITQEGSEAKIKGFLQDWYGEKGGDLWGRMKPETLDDFRRAMGDQLEHLHDWQAKRIINTSVARIRGYADVQQMVDNYVSTMKWFTTTGERACTICGPLHGTQISVAKYHAHMVKQAKLDPDDWAKQIKSLNENHPISGEDLAQATAEAKAKLFEEVGYQQPVHPNCKCILLAVFAATLMAMLHGRKR